VKILKTPISAGHNRQKGCSPPVNFLLTFVREINDAGRFATHEIYLISRGWTFNASIVLKLRANAPSLKAACISL